MIIDAGIQSNNNWFTNDTFQLLATDVIFMQLTF